MKEFPKEFMNLLESVSAKRPRTVIQHILKYGFITSEELKDFYGYNHPPRAVRDVREYGIPVITYRVTGKDGRSVAAYKFGDPADAQYAPAKISGRTILTKTLKQTLINKYGAKCFIYLESMNESDLQIDHRIPYEIAGEYNQKDSENYMLLSPSANRAKSWTCEHCQNQKEKDINFCRSCFWAYPENYEHVAGKYEKVISLVFTGDEIEDYNKLIYLSGEESVQKTIKKILHKHLKE